MNKKLTINEIRRLWLDFFKSKNHLELESMSLIPKNDDSLLWINSGVATLKDYFSGKSNPPSKRLTSSQRCIRTNDIENVGLTSRHHTFFEMLGNFSIGDYFRKEAIEFAAEFIFKVLKFEKEKIYITVFKEDIESYNLWIANGVDKNHILMCDKSRNFWEIGSGPCGPCTEIYYDRGAKYDFNNVGEELFFKDLENDRYIEIWNIVFSEFNNDGKGNYTKLARQNIDTGAGLERLACILQDVPTNYDTDGFVSTRNTIEKYSVYKYDTNLYFEKNKDVKKVFINKSFSTIVDHFKAVIFAISDGALPSNKNRGYILRKLLRRSFLFLDFLKVNESHYVDIINSIVAINQEYYSFLKESVNHVIKTILHEQSLYKNSLTNSFRILKQILKEKQLDAKSLFDLVTTYGFPIEIVQSLQELIANKNDASSLLLAKELINAISHQQLEISVDKLNIDFTEFDNLFKHHREIANKNNSATGIESQNEELINLPVLDSKFDYEIENFEDAKVLFIFDKNWNPVTNIKNESCWVILDKTCFFATTGGQQHDIGKIDNFNVVDVVKSPQGYHLHYVENATFAVNQIVNAQIDSFVRKIMRKQHSSAHLLHAALKSVISRSIKQEGISKTMEKITLDFNYNQKLDFSQIVALEKEVKRVIKLNNKTTIFLKTLAEIKQMGAIAYFEDVYKKIAGKLRVVQLSDDSIEACGGTHVYYTGEVEDFQIINLISKGTGWWRIEAIASNYLVNNFKNTTYKTALESFKNYLKAYKEFNIKDAEIEALLNVDPCQIHYLELKKYNEMLKNKTNILKAHAEKDAIENKAVQFKNANFTNLDKNKTYFFKFNDIEKPVIQNALTNAINEQKEVVLIVVNQVNDTYNIYLATNNHFATSKNINLNDYSKILHSKLEGRSGGKPNFVQGSILKFDQQTFDQIIKLIDQKINYAK
ncbi:MAG: alanine--tRNA ligase [Malacoplasma sp.]|nr:alanine--tRNA ligase [Malacoplasma sp.]